MKPVLIVSEHERLVELTKERDQKDAFINKALDDLKEKVGAIHDAYWDEIYKYIEEKGLIKDARKKPFTIQNDVLYLREEGEGNPGLESFIKSLAAKLNP